MVNRRSFLLSVPALVFVPQIKANERIVCWLFGHDWLHYDSDRRKCTRCGTKGGKVFIITKWGLEEVDLIKET
jgi:hypothetical protein